MLLKNHLKTIMDSDPNMNLISNDSKRAKTNADHMQILFGQQMEFKKLPAATSFQMFYIYVLYGGGGGSVTFGRLEWEPLSCCVDSPSWHCCCWTLGCASPAASGTPVPAHSAAYSSAAASGRPGQTAMQRRQSRVSRIF